MENEQLLSLLLRNKLKVFLFVENLKFRFWTSAILLGKASRKNVKLGLFEKLEGGVQVYFRGYDLNFQKNLSAKKPDNREQKREDFLD